MEGKIIRNLRQMAWERAKGELKSMTHTFWDEVDSRFITLVETINKFIEEIEDNGLQE